MFRTPTAALLCVLLTSPLAAQTDRATDRPNLSGTWVMDTRRSESAQAPDDTRITSATIGTSGSIGSVIDREGPTLVTVTPHEVNGMAVTTTERWSLSADGKTMTVVTTLAIQHGYEGLSGKNYSSPITDVYIRQSK